MQRILASDVRLVAAVTLAVPLLLAIALPLYFSGTPGTSATQATPTPVVIAASTPRPAPTPTADAGLALTSTAAASDEPVNLDPELAETIDELIGDQEGVYGVIVADPEEGTLYTKNERVPFLAASLYKLVLMADIYAAIEQGTIAPDEEVALRPEYYPESWEPMDSYFDPATAPSSVPIDEALFATGAYSSNVAARALMALTDDARLEATARAMGMPDTHFHVDPTSLPGWPPAPEGESAEAIGTAVSFIEEEAEDGPQMLTTPKDMQRFFTALFQGEVVNEAVSESILDILKRQAVDDRFPCLLPAGTEMAHKTGNLDHVVHDVGIIWGEQGPVILIAMAEDPPDDAETTLVIQRLAAIAAGEDTYPSVAEAYEMPELSCGILSSAF